MTCFTVAAFTVAAGGFGPSAISRCHALTASPSLSSPFTPRLVCLPCTVAYHAPLPSLNHGLLCFAIGKTLADAYLNSAPNSALALR